MNLQAEPRTILGKRVKILRKHGLIPAELYGRDTDNLHLAVQEKDFAKIYREAGEHTIVNLKTGGRDVPVIIYGAERDPMTGRIISVDFHRVRMDEKIHARVPIEFTGEPTGVKQSAFIFVTVLDELEIEALPNDIPHSIKVDVSALTKAGDAIHIGNLKLRDKIKPLSPPETVICSLSEKQEEITEPAAAPTIVPTAETQPTEPPEAAKKTQPARPAKM